MRTLLPLAVLLAACGSDPVASPDPTEAANAAGVGGSTSADASSAVDASSSADAASSADASASSSEASSGVGGEGGAPPATTSSSTGAGGDGGQSTEGGGYDDGSRIKTRYFVGADGSRIPRDTFDTRIGLSCSFLYVATDGKNRCLPVASGSAVGFSDAACTMPIGAWASTTCGTDYALAYSPGETPDGCVEGRHEVYQRGAAIAVGTPKYSNASGSCLDFGVTNDTHYHATIVPPTSFVEATTVVGDD